MNSKKHLNDPIQVGCCRRDFYLKSADRIWYDRPYITRKFPTDYTGTYLCQKCHLHQPGVSRAPKLVKFMELCFDNICLLVQCTTVEGVQVDVSIGSNSGLNAATYMAEKVALHKSMHKISSWCWCMRKYLRAIFARC